jgi:hypothetical protein
MTAIGGETSSINQEGNSQQPAADYGLPKLSTPTAARLRTLRAKATSELEDSSASERSSMDAQRKQADGQRGYEAV